MDGEVLSDTYSLCPVCGQRIGAQRKREGNRIYLEKKCQRHGVFRSLVWKGYDDFSQWIRGGDSGFAKEPQCPNRCGLCADHLQETCCTLLEVTGRCNLSCSYCFAGVGQEKDPELATVKSWIEQLVKPGKTLLQLSGGEPTQRDDLPEITAHAKAAGCAYVQLNSNGVRLGEEPDYLARLAEAGLSFVFLQFDGCNDLVHQTIRGLPLLEIKKKAIENCAKHNIGVTLVPTLVPGLNTDQIGNILRFAVHRSPAVRGVHFQPLGQLGRIPVPPNEDLRFTLDELLYQMEKQSDGVFRRTHFERSHCNHPLCGFHGDFVVLPEDEVMPLSRRRSQVEGEGGCCSSTKTTADQNRAFISRRWLRPPETKKPCGYGIPQSLDGFLQRVRSHGFTVTAMAFQDIMNIDLERLRRCSLHVFDQGRFVPFCAHYIGRASRS